MKKLACLVIGIVIATAFLYGYRNVNQQFPAPTVISTPKGEQAELQEGIMISVDGKEILGKEEKDKIYEEENYRPNMDTEFLEVKVTLENTTEKGMEVSLAEINIEAMGFSNGIYDVSVDSTDTEEKIEQYLKPHEKRQISIRYELLSNMYAKKNWEKVAQDRFYLTYSLYPEKRMLELE